MNNKLTLIIALGFLLILNACEDQSQTDSDFSLETLSARADMISGDSVLLGAQVKGLDGSFITFKLNGTTVIVDFELTPIGKVQPGLLTGLKPGQNTLQVYVDGEFTKELILTAHPVSGPIFSGPQQSPYLCLSELAPDRNGQVRGFDIGNGERLNLDKLDENCHLPRRVDYVYISREQSKSGFQALTDLSQIPEDVAVINTESGAKPFVVLLETGTINRAVYQIATLVNVEGKSKRPHWNRRLIYTFGGGCEAGFHQGTDTGGVLRESLLAQGYAIASSTLNVNRQGGCNDVVSAETAMMVKEHFIETVGLPDHTIGLGSSGGAMQQHLIANAYPGILDGLIVGASFPDPITYFMDSADCALPLRNYLNNIDVSDEVKTAIGGWQQWATCDLSLGQRPARISPYDCAGEIPVDLAYNETTNPKGIRCSIYDSMKNIFGEVSHPRIENLTVAPTPHDNVGVQYGLRALQAGLINKGLFLDLNENVGGWDVDYQPTGERIEANPQALERAYQTGRIANGKSLANIPIIDDRAYLDAIGNFHTSVYSFSLRARLIRDNGHADNHIIRRHPRDQEFTDDNVRLMDAWLTNLSSLEGAEVIDNIRKAKPKALADDCFTDDGTRIVEPAVFTETDVFQAPKGQCNQRYPVHANPRIVAGGPLTGDVMKCALKPINWREYGIEFNEAEQARLTKIFPNGVCDWSKPGRGQQDSEVWLSY
jgi:hypothetical protein